MIMIDLINRYYHDQQTIKKEYQETLKIKFGITIDTLVMISTILENMINNEYKRYMSLYNHILTLSDNTLNNLLYEKLESEYENIIQRDNTIKKLLALDSSSNIDIIINVTKTILDIFDSNINLQEKLQILQDIHNIHTKIHTNIHDINIHDNKVKVYETKLNEQNRYIINSINYDASNCELLNIKRNSYSYNSIYDSSLRPGEMAFISSLP